ncbi:hypothetical protein B620_gp02 [Croceibacter phage P2559S]|uniref:hypothetical protein n=1 Tax=Croceibacter phage P2559S TaxID=1176422 RepID=UPI0002688E67|nr:hypothetical protein B620_gp02 [Croceibacter phage P2559S]AFM54780.1 hypothetical protein P2559S_02 [Croceibacter phage P2559S]
MYLVYKSDNQHSYQSLDLIAVATTKAHAIQLICNQASNENEIISDDDNYNLNNIKQTQGYAGDGEFLFSEIETNTLL